MEIAKLLIERGADKMATRNCGLGPVHSAAEAGQLPMLKLILEGPGGVDKLVPTSSGRTLVHVAAGFGQVWWAAGGWRRLRSASATADVRLQPGYNILNCIVL